MQYGDELSLRFLFGVVNTWWQRFKNGLMKKVVLLWNIATKYYPHPIKISEWVHHYKTWAIDFILLLWIKDSHGVGDLLQWMTAGIKCHFSYKNQGTPAPYTRFSPTYMVNG